MIFLGGCATTPTEFTAPAPLAAADRAALNARVFASAWDLVNEKYYDATFRGVDWPAMRTRYAAAATAAPDDDALYRELNQMVGELRDKHIYAIPPRRLHEGRAQHRPDVGLRQQQVDGKWIVTEIVPGSPAEAAGVQRGWVLVARNEQPLPADSRLDPFVPHVGEPVRYAFVDEHDQPRTLSLVPQLLPLDGLDFVSRELTGGIRYLRFDRFDADAMWWFVGEMKTHRDAPGMIVDLRHNRGGAMDSLRRAAGQFFPERRSLGETKSRAGKTETSKTVTILSAQYGGTVAILTSGATASSAEIFAHALQFYRRATVVGQRTQGSMVGGTDHALPGGGRLFVAVVDYTGLQGRRLEGVGVTPDIVVPLELADLRAGRDTVLDTALASLRGKSGE